MNEAFYLQSPSARTFDIVLFYPLRNRFNLLQAKFSCGYYHIRIPRKEPHGFAIRYVALRGKVNLQADFVGILNNRQIGSYHSTDTAVFRRSDYAFHVIHLGIVNNGVQSQIRPHAVFRRYGRYLA